MEAKIKALEAEVSRLKTLIGKLVCTCEEPMYDNTKWCWRCNKMGKQIYEIILKEEK